MVAQLRPINNVHTFTRFIESEHKFPAAATHTNIEKDTLERPFVHSTHGIYIKHYSLLARSNTHTRSVCTLVNALALC